MYKRPSYSGPNRYIELCVPDEVEPQTLYDSDVIRYLIMIYSCDTYTHDYAIQYELLAIITNIFQLENIDIPSMIQSGILNYIISNESFFTKPEYATAYSSFLRNISANSMSLLAMFMGIEGLTVELVGLDVLGHIRTLLSIYKNNSIIARHLLCAVLNLSAASICISLTVIVLRQYRVSYDQERHLYRCWRVVANLWQENGQEQRGRSSHDSSGCLQCYSLSYCISPSPIVLARNLTVLGSTCLTTIRAIDNDFQDVPAIHQETQSIIQLYSDYCIDFPWCFTV